MEKIKFEHIIYSDANKIRFEKLVKQLDSEYSPPISSLVNDIQIYIEKMIEKAIVIIATYNKEDIGFIAIYCNDIKNKIAYITSLSVKKEFQSKKIGKNLVEIAIQCAIERNMSSIELEVQKENSLVMSFYSKFGFYIKLVTDKQSIVMKMDLENFE